MKTLTLAALGLIMTTNSLLACMIAPKPIVWYTPKDKAFHYSVKKEGLVTVVSAKDHKKVLWSTKLDKFSPVFDRVHVVDDGNRIVCVKGNHRVGKLTDIAVTTITKDGTKGSHTAKEFIAKLQPGTPPGKPRISIAPRLKWMNLVKTVDGKSITIVNALNETKTVAWN